MADSTAAGGLRAYNPNRNAAKVNTPVAAPSSAVTLSFIADPSQSYKLWVRLKADGNSFSNDSVWVQFSGVSRRRGETRLPCGNRVRPGSEPGRVQWLRRVRLGMGR